VIFMPEKKDDEKFTSVLIPTSLVEKIEKRIQGTEFSSISSYITYVLKEVVSDVETEDAEELSKEDDERIKARLRSLGYLD
jgi:Arc/MetJ-type ribon-helix-helix transcriptional regulator